MGPIRKIFTLLRRPPAPKPTKPFPDRAKDKRLADRTGLAVNYLGAVEMAEALPQTMRGVFIRDLIAGLEHEADLAKIISACGRQQDHLRGHRNT